LFVLVLVLVLEKHLEYEDEDDEDDWSSFDIGGRQNVPMIFCHPNTLFRNV
jgi:hypothetical protein